MSVLQVNLNEKNTLKAGELSRQTGKTPEQLVNEAFEKYSATAADEEEERRRFLAWREALLRIEGMWADRDDLPDFQDIRRSMDRDLWENPR